MNEIQEYIMDMLPSTKTRGEWHCFDCPSCHRQSEGVDRKKRGGIRFDGDGIVYHCFNCKYVWGWTPGTHMSKRMEWFLQDMGKSGSEIMELRKIIDQYLDKKPEEKKIVRVIRDIPPDYKSIKESLYNDDKSKTLEKIYHYISTRNERLLTWENLMWAEGKDSFLIPCYEFGKVVGYSLRSISDDTNNKYIHYTPNGYIYNFDNLLKNRKYNIIVEGELDALSIDGLALLSNTFTKEKLKRLMDYKGDSEIIILPDNDEPGKKLIKQVLDEKLPFSVSFPKWDKGIKDAEEAVKKYGRLYTIYKIINNLESDHNKIRLKMLMSR